MAMVEKGGMGGHGRLRMAGVFVEMEGQQRK